MEHYSYPKREGNQVVPLIDGNEAFGAILDHIQHAKHRVYGIIAFIEPFLFAWGDGGPSLWKVLAKASETCQVQLLCWRNPHWSTSEQFFGTPEQLQLLSPSISVRWDESPTPLHCHHQKSWIVDDVGFVGGMNLEMGELQSPQHDSFARIVEGRRSTRRIHDVYVQLQGLVVEDVLSNFVQRWNGAKARISSSLPKWPSSPLELSSKAWKEKGKHVVQVIRTIAPDLYDGLADGECSILAAYRDAWTQAKHSIYIENQMAGDVELLRLLEKAVQRGVEVVFIVPSRSPQPVRKEHQRYLEWKQEKEKPSRYSPCWDLLESMENHPNFCLAGLWVNDSETYTDVYVHAKVCIVDGVWLTVGSANIIDISLQKEHSELNVQVWNADTSMGLLQRLAGEHLCKEVPEEWDATRIVQELSKAAKEQHHRKEKGIPLEAHIVAMQAKDYGE